MHPGVQVALICDDTEPSFFLSVDCLDPRTVPSKEGGGGELEAAIMLAKI